MAGILEKIVRSTRRELDARMASRPEADLERAALGRRARGGFLRALRPAERGGDIRLIAEIKKASPSKGLIRPDFDPPSIARRYEAAGAAAISVLTDGPFFQGDLEHLRSAAAAVRLPLLRKDFILERYQLLEAREAGASAVLLIAAVLDDGRLGALLKDAEALGLDALTEVHDREELDRAVALGAPAVGINNRDLGTFEVDLETTLRLRPHIPEGCLAVSESGIFTREDVLRLQRAGVDAVLVGESLMRHPDPGAAVRALLGSASS